MRQFATIAGNAFMELVRQPVFLLLMTTSAVFIVFLSSVQYFGFGEEFKLVKDSALAVTFLAGLFGAVLSASASVAREIRTGTALAVLAKPIGRAQFLLAKYTGLAAALAVLTYVNMVACLLASRMAFDAYGETDLRALAIFAGFLVLAYAIAGFSNFFLRRTFTADAVLCVAVMITLAFVVIYFVPRADAFRMTDYIGVDWRMAPAALLILFALWILAAIALLCSTRLDMIPTLAICSALFVLGLMSDYLFGRPASEGSWWASVLYTITPNWQLFWLADAIEGEKQIPLGYIGKSFGYVAGYVGAALALALLLFEDRELT
jgi:ABC-type transport system involved in multi-copper enzyme maturation permease subunit